MTKNTPEILGSDRLKRKVAAVCEFSILCTTRPLLYYISRQAFGKPKT